ncbi:MAG: Gfo/Idh/MocA family oxidoreductase [Armatimonadetes bacterium]|nr:Gfo/Idh/MocA family oxidoreductase [Armatimonadota bacterium]
MKTIKVGVIGTGGISNAHMGGYQKVKDVEVVAGADIVPGRAKEWAQRHNVPHAFEDYRKLLLMDEIELVSVCTYNRAHMQPTVDALKAGKHVLVEKPMSDDLAEAYKMMRTAQETGKLLMCAIHSRYNPAHRAARHIIKEGALGKIYYAETAGTRRRGIPGGTFIGKETAGRGAIVDIGVYAIDTALFIMDFPKPAAVSAVMNDWIGKHSQPLPFAGGWKWDPEKLEVEEFGAAWVRFEDGRVMVFKISWAVHLNSMGGTFFLGTEGGMQMSPLQVYKDMFGCMVDITPKDLPEYDGFRDEIQAMVSAIREGGPSPVPAEEVIWTNVIMDGIYRSALEGGKEVPVGLPE